MVSKDILYNIYIITHIGPKLIKLYESQSKLLVFPTIIPHIFFLFCDGTEDNKVRKCLTKYIS